MSHKFFLLPIAAAGSLLLTSCADKGGTEFHRADLNKDKRLTTEEIENHLIKAIFARADRNEDMEVSFAEWLHLNPKGAKALFEARDTSGDGAVSLEEFQKYADATGMFDEALRRMDTNNDGFVSSREAEVIIVPSAPKF